MTQSHDSNSEIIALVFRLKTGCRQYLFYSLEELQAWAGRKPYKDEFVFVIVAFPDGHCSDKQRVHASKLVEVVEYGLLSEAGQLSPKMQKAYSRLLKHGRLIKYTGGFWSAPGVEIRHSHITNTPVPAWHFGTQTIQGLIRRKLIKVVRERKWEDKVYPVEVAL